MAAVATGHGMSDDYGFQARRAQGGSMPPLMSGLATIIQNFLGKNSGSPAPDEPIDPNKPTVPLSGDNINSQQPAQELRAAGPQSYAPQEVPPEVPQEPSPEHPGPSTRQAPEVPAEPDQPQPDPTTQPIIEPAPPDPT